MSYASSYWWDCCSGSDEGRVPLLFFSPYLLFSRFQAVTSKFMPIRQFFYFDAIECLPEDVFQSAETAFKPTIPTNKSRYYSQEIVFGSEFQERICKSKYFVVKFLHHLEKFFLKNIFDQRLAPVPLVVKC